MTISKEVKIGILALIVIFCSVWGFRFIKGNNLFDDSMSVFIETTDARQVPRSAPVYYLGAEVGNVSDVLFPPDKPNKVVLKLNIKLPINMPKTAVANFFPNGVMGGTAIEILFSKPCSGGDCAQNGDFLTNTGQGFLSRTIGSPEQLSAYMQQVKNGAAGVYDTLALQMNDPNNELNKTFKSLQATITNLQAATAATQKLISASSSSLDATLKSVASITQNLEASNAQIRSTIANLEATSQNIKAVDINKTMTGANDAIATLKKTLTTSEQTIANLNGMVSKMQDNSGSLGKLMSSDSLYNALNLTVFQAQGLMQDLRLNPRRYVNLNPFKKYKPYVAPQDDPLKPKSGN